MPLTASEACERVQNYLQSWTVAHLNQIPVVFSEDFNPGQVTEGIRFVTPFAEDFELGDWVT